MKGLLIFAAAVVCCLARPDIALKLREQALKIQSNSNGRYLPPADLGNSGSGQQHYYHNKEIPGHVSQVGVTFQTLNGGDSVLPVNIHTTSHGSSFQNDNSFEHSSHGSHSSHESTVVNKYFFNAPEDIPAPLIRIHQHVENKKNLNTIFIKAPKYEAPRIQLPVIQEQQTEKTQIYVLVKKPEEVQHIEIPSIAPSKPAKPEVFFIKYKTQKEAHDKIEHIQNGGSGDEIKSTDLGSDASLVNTIRDEVSTGNVITGPSHHSGSFETVSLSGYDKSGDDHGYGKSGNDHGYDYSTPGRGASHLVHRPSALYRK